ncbi:hypothetical protein ACERJO_15435 [Halalkalibacter sp. AB-rgal2]|uniref:hypothetical protein n=1 Tax=Halalkalibacter sp. AB-rgal2 TaxID=3242695 RepID=UPI00359CEBC5
MKVHSFIEKKIGSLKNKDILQVGMDHSIEKPSLMIDLAELKNINQLASSNQYDVILITDAIDKIPVFEMEQLWVKLKTRLKRGGCLIINTPTHDSPNEFVGEEVVHVQTKGSLMRSCLKHHFICILCEQNYFAFVLRDHLSSFEKKRSNEFLFFHNKLLEEAGIDFEKARNEEELSKLMPTPGRVMIGCVTENNEKYRDQTLRLVRSIRWFGGRMAGVNIFVCIVDEADPNFVEELERLGVFVRIVKRFSKWHPQSNKMRFFELPETKDYDTILFLDCDTVIVRDPSDYITGEHFQAALAAGLTVPYEQFEEIFSFFKLPMLPREHRTVLADIRTIMYCNAGVLIFPQRLMKEFYPVWKKYTKLLIKHRDLLGRNFNFCEQASLTLAYASKNIPFQSLPYEMNFHLVSRKLKKIIECDPVIIHYHNRITEEKLLKEKTRSPYAIKRIRELNQRLEEVMKKKKGL